MSWRYYVRHPRMWLCDLDIWVCPMHRRGDFWREYECSR